MYARAQNTIKITVDLGVGVLSVSCWCVLVCVVVSCVCWCVWFVVVCVVWHVENLRV